MTMLSELRDIFKSGSKQRALESLFCMIDFYDKGIELVSRTELSQALDGTKAASTNQGKIMTGLAKHGFISILYRNGAGELLSEHKGSMEAVYSLTHRTKSIFGREGAKLHGAR